MSRDFTPRDKAIANARFKGLYLQNITQQYSDGRVVPLFSEEEQKLRQKYPNLAVTSTKILLDLNKDLPKEIKFKVINKVETLIKNIIVMDGLNDFRACPKEAKEWYFGQLDKNFYYSETNDNLFYDFIMQNIVPDIR